MQPQGHDREGAEKPRAATGKKGFGLWAFGGFGFRVTFEGFGGFWVVQGSLRVLGDFGVLLSCCLNGPRRCPGSSQYLCGRVTEWYPNQTLLKNARERERETTSLWGSG